MVAATKTKATVKIKGKALLGIRSRKWMEEELKQFAEVLAEDFAFDLETWRLKSCQIGKQRPGQRHQEERREQNS